MSVITVSRQMASLGTEIAQALAERLHYEYADKERIGKVLADYGLPSPDVERFDEKKPPFWDSWQIQRRKFLHFIQAVIYDLAGKGNVVIVGRGGQVLLRDIPGILHVRIVAPFEVRLRRILGKEGGDEKQVLRTLRRSDRDSAGFIRSFFDVDWDDLNLYDLVINTQKISTETGVSLIQESLRSPEIKESEKKAEGKLADLAISQKAEATLLGLLGIDIRHLNFQVDKGVIILRGAVNTRADRENCQRAVAGIEGVQKVDNQLLVTENYRFGS
jgi:cytidylate kinase